MLFRSKEIVKLTAGDYTIHFLIQKTKELAISEGSTATVIVELEIGKDHEFTKPYPEQSSSSETIMMDHIFIEKRN